MFIYVSEEHGCAYRIHKDLDSDGDWLECTPLFIDGTWSRDDDDWYEVDHMALLGEEEDVRLHVDWVEDRLRLASEGVFAGQYV